MSASTPDHIMTPCLPHWLGGCALTQISVTDIDAAVTGDGTDLEALVETLVRHRMEPRIPDAIEFARQRQVLLMRHVPSRIPLEISLAWLPFEVEALARARVVDFGGVRLRVATPEDLVVYKAVAWRDRDRTDIERLLVRHRESIDLERVRALVRQCAVALDEPERVADFDALIERAGGR